MSKKLKELMPKFKITKLRDEINYEDFKLYREYFEKK